MILFQQLLTAVTDFEIGSRGYISSRNHSALYSLHKFAKPGIKLSKFKENISALAVYSSYHIFITRNEESFNQPSFLLPPFEHLWKPMKIYTIIWNSSNTLHTVIRELLTTFLREYITGILPLGQHAAIVIEEIICQMNLKWPQAIQTLSWVNT